MQVTINEEFIPEDFSHVRNLEEALVELNDRFVPPGQQLFQVRVNGEFFSERYPRESKYMELREISTLDLKTIPDGDMARVILGEAVEQAGILCHAIEKSARLFRVSAEDEANRYFAQVIEALRWLLITWENACQVLQVDPQKAISSVGGRPSSFVQGLQDLCGEMLEISEDEDYILLADLMEYELLPMVREWQHILENLAKN
jgi:hypothetical protein